MLVYMRSTLSINNSFNIFLYNYKFKTILIFQNINLMFHLYISRLLLKFIPFFEYYMILSLFFKNNWTNYINVMKNCIRKYSFSRFVSNYTDQVSLTIKSDNLTNMKVISQTYSTNYIYALIKLQKLNFLKLSNFFVYLLYIIPLIILNYYSLLSWTFGHSSNLRHVLHGIWSINPIHTTIFKYHL